MAGSPSHPSPICHPSTDLLLQTEWFSLGIILESHMAKVLVAEPFEALPPEHLPGVNTVAITVRLCTDASRPRNTTHNDEPSSGGSFNPALIPYLGLLISLDCYAVQLIDCGKSVHLTVLLRVSSAGIILDILPTNFTFQGEFLSPWLILDTQQKHQQTYPLVN